ncbi:Syntaxin-22 [Striga hermonthica]|uniref:Syntaxin-22 n=1 Tax=Striga hermonthica TaxID=68872 RepID=A0A9N7N8I8_STRHE|nr:Syntaxin-22 [Striga hermonthica]
MSFQDLEAGRGGGTRRGGFVNGKQDPTQAVASGIFQINTAVSTFQRLVNAIGTPKDTPELREKLHKTRLHIGQLVKDTSAKLKQASETDHRADVSTNKKITDAKLAKDFQAVLKELQKVQRLAAEKETSYTTFIPQAVLPSSYTATEIDVNSDKTPEQRALLFESRRQEVLLLDNEIAFNEAIIDEREQGIQEIQQQIGEVNEIFKDLAVLVHEQGTMIDDIGSNIEGAHAATAQGKSQLVKAAKTQRSNSSLDLEAGRGAGIRRGLVNGKQDPTQAVASGIFQITTAVSTFQRLVNALGTPKDTPELREKLHKTRLHIGQLVKDTSAKLKQASETDHHAEVSTNKKITDAKLAKDFQAVLKEFQKAQRLAAERETTYTTFAPQAILPSSYTAGEVDASLDKTPEQRALLVESRRQEVLLLDNEIAFNEAIIEEREQGIQEIQQQIGEVNEIFKDLAVLVHDQGTMIDDIGSNIEGAHAATAQGKSQLVKAAKTQRSNSSLTCLLLVIFGIVLLIVVIVLAA